MDPRPDTTHGLSKSAHPSCPPGATNMGASGIGGATPLKDRPEQNVQQNRPGQSGVSGGDDAARQLKAAGRDAAQRAREATSRAREAGEGMIDETRRAARQYAHLAKERGQEMIELQKRRAADQIHTVSEAVHRAADKFREDKDDNIAGYVDAMADEVDRLANYLERHDARRLVRDAQHFARREPEWFLGGMFLAGLALTRFLRASGRGDSYEYEHARGESEFDREFDRDRADAYDQPHQQPRPTQPPQSGAATLSTSTTSMPSPAPAAPIPAPGAQGAEVHNYGQ